MGRNPYINIATQNVVLRFFFLHPSNPCLITSCVEHTKFIRNKYMPFSNQIACLGYQLEKQESSYSKHSKKWYYLEQRSLIYDFKKGEKGVMKLWVILQMIVDNVWGRVYFHDSGHMSLFEKQISSICKLFWFFLLVPINLLLSWSFFLVNL